jgi:acetate kinase
VDEYALVLNAGSSSLKFCVFQRPAEEGWRVEARGQIEGIGVSPRLTVKNAADENLAKEEVAVRDSREAVDVLAGWLRSKYGGSRVLGVGHRVVHGGRRFAGPTVMTRQILAELQELVPLPREIRQTGVQRYGFHGLSYEYIASVLPQFAPEIADGRVIVAHLGSGASMCAMRAGKSVDSTLGFTALDGLCMGTRPGALDPGVVLHLFQGLKLSAGEVEGILYKKSGLLGISGTSNDMRQLLGRTEPDARLAVDYFVYRAAKEIGALAAVLGGVDAVVFTAGIGENSVEIRQRICEASAWLGLELDPIANAAGGPLITSPESKVSAWVIPTNEELMIARHMARLLGWK